MADGCPVSYQNEETVGGEVLMSRDGWEHREDQAAEDQDEPKQNNRETKERIINTTYTQNWNQTRWHQRPDLWSRHIDQQITSQIPKHDFRWSQICCWSWKCALKWKCPLHFPLWQTLEPILALKEDQNMNNLAAQSQNLFPLCSEPWARLLFHFLRYQVNHACFCVTWFARNKQWNCGYWKTSNIRPFPHSECGSLRQETVAFHLHNHNMFFFHHINLPKTHRCLKYERGV